MTEDDEFATRPMASVVALPDGLITTEGGISLVKVGRFLLTVTTDKSLKIKLPLGVMLVRVATATPNSVGVAKA